VSYGSFFETMLWITATKHIPFDLVFVLTFKYLSLQFADVLDYGLEDKAEGNKHNIL
jgi:hypothetical protein